MDRFMRGLERIGKDLRDRRNIEAYAATFFVILFAILTIVGDIVPTNIKEAAMLSALGLLVYNLTVPKDASLTSYDQMLNDRTDFKQPFSELVRSATQLYMYAPSAVNVLNSDNLKVINDSILSRKGGEFKIIMQDPEEIEAVKILSRQLDENVIRQVQDLPSALTSTYKKLRNISTWERKGVFEYKLLSFGPGFSLVVVNPNEADGVVVVEFYGYMHEDTSSRMHIELTRKDSERWYNYWVSQFDVMWKDARYDGEERIKA